MFVVGGTEKHCDRPRPGSSIGSTITAWDKFESVVRAELEEISEKKPQVSIIMGNNRIGRR
jgi:hypothetical protein